MAGNVEGTSVGQYDCLGPSMLPTLKPGDALRVVPYDGARIRPGDVVVFCPIRGAALEGGHHVDAAHPVVHRVVTVDARGIITRGDNNPSPDPWVLRADDVLGRVLAVWKENKWVRVPAGLWGVGWARMLSVLRAFDRIVSCVLRPAYRWLARAGVFSTLLPHCLRLQVLSFERPEGVEKLLISGRRVIGRRLPGASQWHIQRPFRLFIDEASLPGGVTTPKVCQEPPCQQ